MEEVNEQLDYPTIIFRIIEKIYRSLDGTIFGLDRACKSIELLDALLQPFYDDIYEDERLRIVEELQMALSRSSPFDYVPENELVSRKYTIYYKLFRCQIRLMERRGFLVKILKKEEIGGYHK